MFLVAIQTVFTFWSQVGGQYHLDLMFWPWKFVLSVIMAGLITAMAASPWRRRLLASLLIIVMVIAGTVTYYYHVNEPDDEGEQSDEQQTQLMNTLEAKQPSRSDLSSLQRRAHGSIHHVFRK